jgi:acyl carrier protein
MIPSAFVFLDAFPLTTSGKVDRLALPVPDEALPQSRQIEAAPRTGMEQAVAAIWQDVLHVEPIGADDNFFDIGGHSLLAMQVHSWLQEKLQIEVSMIDLFRHPTVRSLVDFIASNKNNSSDLEKSRDRAELRRKLRDRQLK